MVTLAEHLPSPPDTLVEYAHRLANAGLSTGTGGNISVRHGDTVWMKPSGFALDELAPEDVCGVHLRSGKRSRGIHPVTGECDMHLAVYRARPKVAAVFHVHAPWLSGIITAGVQFRPILAETVFYLGRIATIPYVLPTSSALTDVIGLTVEDHETILMPHHGLLTTGETVREAYHRCLVAEDSAKALVAAATVGTPQYLTPEQIRELRGVGGD